MIEAVTGSHGHIGSRLVEHLKSAGHEVKRLAHPEPEAIWRIPKSFDHLFHLATYGSHKIQQDVIEIVDANYFQTWKLLAQTRDHKFKGMVIAGTSSEYGRKIQPMNELDSLNPESLYAAAKAGATHLTQVWARQFDKPIVIARPFSVYGPGEAEYRFIPTVIRSCLKQEPMTLDENGNHDFIYVDDVIDGLLLLADLAPIYKGEVFNLGTGIMTNNRTIIESIEHLTGKRANITEVKSLRPNDSQVWVADMAKMQRLGWKTKTSLAKGLARTVDHYAKIYS